MLQKQTREGEIERTFVYSTKRQSDWLCKYPILYKWSRVSLLLAIVCVMTLLFGKTFATKTGTCEYDLDLSSKKVKIICQGSSSMVNVYANKAFLHENYNENFVQSSYGKQFMKGKRMSHNLTPDNRNWDTITRQPSPSEPELEHSERLTVLGQRYKKSVQVVDAPGAGEGLQSTLESSFARVVVSVSEKLYKAKQNLSSLTASIKNISTQLGDAIQRPDMDSLRRGNNSVTDLKEGVIAALRNQYNFMSSALLLRSYELQKLASAMTTLIDVTGDGFNSALTAHRMLLYEVSILEAFLLRLRKRVSRSMSRRENSERHETNTGIRGTCPKLISAIGAVAMTKVHWPTGSYMVDSASPSDRRSVFMMVDTDEPSQLREYHTALEMDYNLVGKHFLLPFYCSGAGNIVYGRHFYCHKSNTNLIVKYHLKRKRIVSELALPGVPSSSSSANIDLAADELGVWAVYSTDVLFGNVSLAKIDHKKMEITSTWPTTFPNEQVGHAFIICGVLYITSSQRDTPTFIRYTYNTETKQEQKLDEGAMPLAYPARLGLSDGSQKTGKHVMLSYDHRQSVLYSWNNDHVNSFQIYFKEIEQPNLLPPSIPSRTA